MTCLKNKVIQRWRGEVAAHESYPIHRGRWPDNNTVDILKRLCKGFICEIGCGTGRCSDAFLSGPYMGLDINPEAIKIAVSKNKSKNHFFHVIDWDEPYPDADVYLFYTTLQHIPDGEIHGVLSRCHGRIVIQEIMIPEYRNDRRLAFHRSKANYVTRLNVAGFDVVHFEEHPTNYQIPGNGKPSMVRRFLVAEER